MSALQGPSAQDAFLNAQMVLRQRLSINTCIPGCIDRMV